ncbi:beta strand repeat-containing protein [Parvicella tangerina]|uniref:PKD domain-containing protein n=1 Tax=Parvicella tangerina TaxID=2829795 RepID=A0A916JPE2_9FLAO|nr:PKD domain-containing protein [Parvicella tangerina]CAG5085238.1 hypothetical protein CRYO30217_02696 [Parvicella tangerina]
MKKITKRILSIGLGVLLGTSAFAQLSKGGTPYTFNNATQPKSAIQLKQLPGPDMVTVAATDAINDVSKQNYRVGLKYPVNYNAVNSGTWETTPDGGSLWRLRINIPGAKALGLYYHNFFIPNGGKVFIYNENENHVIGAFTSDYNYENTIRATQMIQGETITLEYYAPAGVTQTPIIEIKEVGYFYRGVEEFVKPFEDPNTLSNGLTEKADNCQVDVACSEITGWEEQRDAVVHYVFPSGGGYAVCSAAMINNTAEDCTPYILTAWHCGEPNAGADISSWVWYWNYQKTTCSPGSNGTDPSKGTDTMTGGTVVASSGSGTSLNQPPGTNEVAGSDFYLVELNSQPPTSYNAFYAGWDRTTTASPSGVGIHHPAGSAKKISTYTSTLGANGNFNGGTANSHWIVQWAATANGHGVTEGGSSGSPIFNNVGRIVGQLSGGSSFCSSPTSTDVYGKMSMNWTANGTTNNSQLEPWLDPIGSGVTTLDGAYEPCNATNPPTCNINASPTSVTAGGSVTFSDGSSGNPTSWSWNFDNTSQGGVSPATSTSQNPGAVTYANPGTYEVELTVTNANGSSTCTQTIVASAFAGCDTLLNIVDTNTLTIYGASGGGFITGVNSYGDLAKAEKYSGYSGTHVTGSDIYIYGLEDGGNGSTVELTIWDDDGTGLPGTILDQASFAMSDLNSVLTGGQGLVFLPFDAPVNVGGNDFYIGLDFNNLGAGDSLGIVSKMVSVSTPLNSAYEQWSDGTWIDMESAWGAGNNFSLYVTAHITDAPVSGSASASTTTACTGSPIDFTATATNATAYNWYTTGGTPTSATTQNTTVTYGTAGNYTAYLVLDGDCEGQIIDSVQVTVTDGPILTATPTDPSCAGNDGSISANATGGATPYQYSIDGGTLQPSGTFTGLSQGSYDILVIDANGCQSMQTVTVNAGSGTLTVSATPTDPSCAGNDGQIDIVASGGATPYSYSTDGGSNFVPTSTFTSLAPGTYSVVVQDNNGCQGTTSVTLNATSGSVTVSATPTDPSCGASDGQIAVTAGGGSGSYTYSNDGGSSFGASSTFTGLAVGTYDIVVEDGNGCQATTSVTLSNSAGPAVAATGTDVSCNGSSDGTATVTATGGTPSYTYSIDGTNFGASSTFTGLAAGSYTIYVNDAGSCQGTASVTIGEPTAVVHTASVSDATCGNSNGSITVTATGGSGPYTYSLNSGTAQASGTFTGLAAGSYTVEAIDANGCVSTASTENVGGGAGPAITSPTISDETCMDANGQIIVNATGGTGSLQYSNDGGATYQTSSVFPGLAAGTYAIVVQDGAGCTTSTSATVTNSGGFSLIVNPASGQTICEGNSVNISASGAGTGASYTWDQGLPTGASHTVSPTVTTVYTVQATDASSCTETASVTITVETEPTVTVIPNNSTICAGNSESLTATGAQSYVWNTGATTPTITVSPTSQTTYTVIGQNGSCAGTPVQVTVGVDPSPTVVANSDVTSIGVGGTVNFDNAGSSATSYSWDFGDGQSSTQGFVSHTYNVAGTYTVTLTGTIGNCTETDQITILVGTSGIDQASLESGVSLYPNPNDGQFNLKLDFGIEQEVDVKLFSAIGQLVESRNLGNVSSTLVEFNLADHAGGVYFVQVNTNSGTITKRITISK